MEKVTVLIAESENNYSACVDGLDGFVCTAETFNELQNEVVSGIDFHLDGMREENNPIPVVFQGDYKLSYKWDVESLLFYYDGIFTRSALERLTGINQDQIGHYAAGRSKPRKKQRKKIENALHRLGDELRQISL